MAVWASHEAASPWPGTFDGNWSTWGITLGRPAQKLWALHSSSGTTIQLPVSPSCSETDLVFTPTYSLSEPVQPPTILKAFDANSSETWEAGSRCGQGTDLLSDVFQEGHVSSRERYFRPALTFRAPLERLNTTYVEGPYETPAFIGAGAIANTWDGQRDYVWDILRRVPKSLFQMIPFLRFQTFLLGRRLPVNYAYTAGAWYRMTTAAPGATLLAKRSNDKSFH
ncbi:Hypothetical predicted protein [Lecanosticta acicola]|uniref:Uncharacterized protein n=1 Tax=Lecanosticta acicola TaxID=111012 RepID=A0AAI8Z0N1_9PEZI|nr:Hypothetical predicted protein [Lecanosticta acicola]